MLQSRPGNFGKETSGHQPLHLLLHVSQDLGLLARVLDLAQHQGLFLQDARGEPCHLLRNQGKTWAALGQTTLKAWGIVGQRRQQEGPIQRNIDDLLLQVV